MPFGTQLLVEIVVLHIIGSDKETRNGITAGVTKKFEETPL